jgi:hypothetical protein
MNKKTVPTSPTPPSITPRPKPPGEVEQAIGEAKTIVANVGWGPLAGCAAVYLAHLRQVEQGTGKPPRKRSSNRTIGRDYER